MQLTVKEYYWKLNQRSKFLFEGSHDVHTPQKLVDEMLSQIDLVDKTILVLYNVEFLVSLYYDLKLNGKNITFLADHPNKIRIANKMGINYIENLDTTMKFDVIVGNPPFKNGNEIGGARSLWRKIVKSSWELLNDSGRLAMIVPQLPNSSADLGTIFSDHQTEVVWTDVAKYFPCVGSTFKAWIVNKTPKFKKTNFIDAGVYHDITNLRLPKNIRYADFVNRIMTQPTFNCISSAEYNGHSMAIGELVDNKTTTHQFGVRRTSGDTFRSFGATMPTDYYTHKVTMTFSGYAHYHYHSIDDPIGTARQLSGHILVNDHTEAANLISLYNSKLYKFVMDQLSSGGMRNQQIYEMPKMPLDKSWSDQELYSHFGLTANEIEYVESAAKTR